MIVPVFRFLPVDALNAPGIDFSSARVTSAQSHPALQSHAGLPPFPTHIVHDACLSSCAGHVATHPDPDEVPPRAWAICSAVQMQIMSFCERRRAERVGQRMPPHPGPSAEAMAKRHHTSLQSPQPGIHGVNRLVGRHWHQRKGPGNAFGAVAFGEVIFGASGIRGLALLERICLLLKVVGPALVLIGAREDRPPAIKSRSGLKSRSACSITTSPGGPVSAPITGVVNASRINSGKIQYNFFMGSP